MVMATDDLVVLAAWLDEEKAGLKRRTAMHRIYHRLNLLRQRRDHEAIDRLANAVILGSGE